MSTIRIVWGTASGPTAMASYDGALAAAGIENYNLVAVSSVIPADVPVDVAGTAPELGPAGERLTVVESRATTRGANRVSAALGWARSDGDGPGLFYEAADETDATDVERRVRTGLEAGCELRDWQFGDQQVHVESERGPSEAYTTALVVAVYGESEPIV